MNLFPDDRILWAGLGNNPPPDSSYWREMQVIGYALIGARTAKTWTDYCFRLSKGLAIFDW